MKKLFLALMAVAAIALTGCEKSKNEPEMNLAPSKDVEAVDLGLPNGIKWANMNIGATKPEECGAYFAWGETTTKRIYDWSTYKHILKGKSSWDNINKYQVPDNHKEGIWYNGDDFIGDNKSTLDLADDAAHVNWGDSWRMPTMDELNDLKTKCTWTWTQKNGINGYEVKGPNGNSIFWPASGHRNGAALNEVGSCSYCWTSSLYENFSTRAYSVFFNSVKVAWDDYARPYGFSVRPVSTEEYQK